MNTAVDFEEEGLSVSDYVSILWRRKIQFLVPSTIIFVIAMLIAVIWPSTYRSTATILIEEQEIPRDLVRSTITSYANQQIQIITQRTMTLRNVMELVERYGLYSEDELKSRTKSEILKEFRDKDVDLNLLNAEVVDPISGRASEAVIAFTLSYQHQNPAKAQKVTNELVTLYLNENLRSRTEKTINTSEFLQTESVSLARQLEELEASIAEFKLENEGSLPELYQYNLNIIERTQRELLESNTRLQGLEKEKIQLEADLIQISPYAPVVLPTGERILNDYDRLKALKSEYSRKLAVYSDTHPDVVRLSREIKVLSQTLGKNPGDTATQEDLRIEEDKLEGLLERYSRGHPEVIEQSRILEAIRGKQSSEGVKSIADEADNPAYIFQQARLKSVNVEKNTLAQKVDVLRKKIRHYESLVENSPNVEKEYLALQRDYLNAQRKYGEIKSKLMAAELGQNLEQGRKGERFTLIQPPILPEKPVSPNRMAIILIGALLSVAAGISLVMLLETMDQGIRGEKKLAALTGSPVLVSIPYICLDKELTVKNRTPFYFAGSIVAFIVVGLILFHSFIKPLDVAWFMLMRKVGLI